MVRRKMPHIVLFVGFMLWSLCAFVHATEQSEFSTSPITNNGEKWRIGYMEGGPYQDYQSIFKAFIHQLAEVGWLEKSPFPQTRDEHETQTIWSWLATDVQSDYLEFVADAYWSAGWDKEERQRNKENIISRLNSKQDIDLMLAFGTWAGLDMANDRYSVPTMVISASDPIQAGIVKSAEDSGYDHLHAWLDPTRFERQVRLFHEAVKFKKLGLAFVNTPESRSYAAIEDVNKAAAELGFEVLECHLPEEASEIHKRNDNMVECYEKLAPHIDAFYITAQVGVNIENLPGLLEPLFKHNVATFAQGSTDEVEHGVLMSMGQEDFHNVGGFYAETFARILNGIKPRDLPQVFEVPPAIAINLETAKKIGFRFPLDILAGAKEIYKHIERVE